MELLTIQPGGRVQLPEPVVWPFGDSGTARWMEQLANVMHTTEIALIAWLRQKASDPEGFGQSGGHLIRKRQMGDSPFRAVGQMGGQKGGYRSKMLRCV